MSANRAVVECPDWCTRVPEDHLSDDLETKPIRHSPGDFGEVQMVKFDDGVGPIHELGIMIHQYDWEVVDAGQWAEAATDLRAIAADALRAADWLDSHAPTGGM